MNKLIIVILLLISVNAYSQYNYFDIGNTRLIDSSGVFLIRNKPLKPIGTMKILKQINFEDTATFSLPVSDTYLDPTIFTTATLDTSKMLFRYDSTNFALRWNNWNITNLDSSTLMKRITSTDLAIPKFDGTTGRIQNSAVTISSANNLTINSTGTLPQLTLSRDGTGGTSLQISNSTTTGYTGFWLKNNTINGIAYQFGTAYTTSGRFIQASYLFDADGAGGMSFCASNASGVVRFYSGGTSVTNERLRVLSTGKVGINRTVTVNNTYAFAGGKLKEFFADEGNTTSTETNAMSYTTDSSRLANNGESLEGEYTGIIVGHATDTRRIRLYFGGTSIYDNTATVYASNTDWNLKFSIVRVSSSVVRCSVTSGLSPGTKYTEVTGLTLTATNILKLTLQSSNATNDIVAKLGYVKWYPAGN